TPQRARIADLCPQLGSALAQPDEVLWRDLCSIARGCVPEHLEVIVIKHEGSTVHITRQRLLGRLLIGGKRRNRATDGDDNHEQKVTEHVSPRQELPCGKSAF